MQGCKGAARVSRSRARKRRRTCALLPGQRKAIPEPARSRPLRRREGFLFAASAAAYGDNPEVPKRETMVPEPCSPYASGKIAGEHLLRVYGMCYGLKTVALRYFNVSAPPSQPTIAPTPASSPSSPAAYWPANR
ncbi:MAG: NAD-dependent epimerase/dehydratase family protein [Planctomycetota bacterium]